MSRKSLRESTAEWGNIQFDYGLDMPSMPTESDVNYSISLSMNTTTTMAPAEYSDIFPVTMPAVRPPGPSPRQKLPTPTSSVAAGGHSQKRLMSNNSSAASAMDTSGGPTPATSSSSTHSEELHTWRRHDLTSPSTYAPTRQPSALTTPASPSNMQSSRILSPLSPGPTVPFPAKRRAETPQTTATDSHWAPVSLARGPQSFSSTTRRERSDSLTSLQPSQSHAGSPRGHVRSGSVNNVSGGDVTGGINSPGTAYGSPTFSLGSSLVGKTSSGSCVPWPEGNKSSPGTVTASARSPIVHTPSSPARGEHTPQSRTASPGSTDASAAAATARVASPSRRRPSTEVVPSPSRSAAASARVPPKPVGYTTPTTTATMSNGTTLTAALPSTGSQRRRTHPQSEAEVAVHTKDSPEPRARTRSADNASRAGLLPSLSPAPSQASTPQRSPAHPVLNAPSPHLSAAPKARKAKSRRESPPALSPLQLVTPATLSVSPSFAPVSIMKRPAGSAATRTLSASPGVSERRSSREALPPLGTPQQSPSSSGALTRLGSASTRAAEDRKSQEAYQIAVVASRIVQKMHESVEEDDVLSGADDSESLSHYAKVAPPSSSTSFHVRQPPAPPAHTTNSRTAVPEVDRTSNRAETSADYQRYEVISGDRQMPVSEMVARLNSANSNLSSNLTASSISPTLSPARATMLRYGQDTSPSVGSNSTRALTTGPSLLSRLPAFRLRAAHVGSGAESDDTDSTS